MPAPRTILRGVRKLPPATMLMIEPDGTRRERRYWDPPFERDPARADWSERDWADAVHEALRVAVERRMVADVPVGVLLSGGLDSSLIVALLAEYGQTRPGDVLGRLPATSAAARATSSSSRTSSRSEFGTDHRQFLVEQERMLERCRARSPR